MSETVVLRRVNSIGKEKAQPTTRTTTAAAAALNGALARKLGGVPSTRATLQSSLQSAKKRGRPSTTLQKMAMPTSEQRDQIADPLYEIEYGSSLDAQARAGLALRQWIIGDFAEQVAADPPRAVRLALVTRELMSIVGSASSRLPIVAATLEELGSRPEHRSARKNAAFAVASAWHPFVDEMDVDEIKQKLSWLGEPTTGSLLALRTRLKKVCAARNGHLERNPVPWIAYHGRLDEGSGKKVRSFSFGLEGGGG
jgi:hypothetical protein